MAQENFTLVCPHCAAINRVPAGRLRDQPKCGRCKQTMLGGQPAVLTDSSFGRYIRNSSLPVVVDFWAPWCGPCKMMAPVFESVAREMGAGLVFAKLDTETNRQTAGELGIRSIPTLALFHGGTEVSRQSGAMDASRLRHWLQQQAPAV